MTRMIFAAIAALAVVADAYRGSADRASEAMRPFRYRH